MIYDFKKRSDDSGLINNEPSCTKQEFQAQCDINNILKKYIKNGVNPFVITQDARYGDFSELPSYQEALDYVTSAQEAFMAMPAQLRKRFDNDPGQLIDFLSDSNNLDEAIKLGLVESPQAIQKPQGDAPAAPAAP